MLWKTDSSIIQIPNIWKNFDSYFVRSQIML